MGIGESASGRSRLGKDRVRSSVQSDVGARRVVAKPVEVAAIKMISNFLFQFLRFKFFTSDKIGMKKRLVNINC